MQFDEVQSGTRGRRRMPKVAVLILVLAVVALGVSMTDQLRQDSSPTPVFVHQDGTPDSASLAVTLSSENSPPDLVSLTDGEESDLAVTAVADVQPAVITVQRASKPVVIGESGNREGDGAIGSGVIINVDGFAIASLRTTGTNEDIQVVFANGVVAEADVVAVDEAYQLVLLEIDGDMPAVATLAGYSPLPGERVFAIGSALDDFYSTVTAGVVGASGVTMPASGNWLPIRGAIQHDAAINEGNEGGPLLDLNGKVIGINVGSVTTNGDDTAQGWSFAVPISSLTDLIDAVN